MVKYEVHAGVARITIDDGKLNVMSPDLLRLLQDAFDRAAGDGALVVLRSGRPGIFSAGFDLKVFASGDARRSQEMVRAGAELALRVLAFPAPVLAVCEGHAFPMGAFLVLASDVRIGVDGPFNIGLNEVAIGIPVPSFALELARQRLVPAYLNRTALTGEMYSLRESVTAGFLDRVVPPEELEATVAATVQALGKVHRESHAIVKQRLRARALQDVRSAIDAELTQSL